MQPFLFFHWKCKNKLSADTLGTDAVDVLVVGGDNLFYDRKTKPGALFVLATGEVAFVETFPDAFDTFFGDSDTGVLDRNKHLIIFLGGLNGNGGIVVAELDSVVNQVIEHLLDFTHIGSHIQFLAA